jgi:hydroxymethylpyrimidine/phosphomethylpyrimidine kinase
MVSTSGAQLLPGPAVKALLSELLPVTTILTPNLPEAQLLLKEAGVQVEEPKSTANLVEMAKALQKLGPKYVLLKGGHLPLTKEGKISKSEADHHTVYNILVSSEEALTVESDFQRSKNTHGTGCSLACRTKHRIQRNKAFLMVLTAAIASNRASGMSVIAAVKAANRYVEAGIKHSHAIGKGSGPINHFHSTYTLPFSPYVLQWAKEA